MEAKPIRFDLVGILTEQFVTRIGNKPDSEEIEVKTSVSFNVFGKGSNIISVSLRTEYLNPESGKHFLVAEIQCAFILDSEDWDALVDEEKAKITLPYLFAVDISNIAIGALRGVVHAKTEDSDINFVLPFIRPEEMISGDVELEM